MTEKIKHLLKLSICLLFLLPPFRLRAQIQNPALPDTSYGEKVENLRIGGYVDLYYGSFHPSPAVGDLPYFVSMNQNRQVAVNLACIDLRYAKDRIRARLIPGFGSYMNANYAGEPGGLANLVEANLGYCLDVKRQIWVDAGILSSPYSNESCFSRDHLMYSRSLAPEFVPYYLSGVKGSMPLSGKLNLSLYFLNGWQQIRDRNRAPAFGTQLEWRPGNRSLLNWNTFIGNEQNPEAGLQGSFQRMRWFTDVYWVFNPEGKITATSCAYLGLQEYAPGFGRKQTWWWQANAQLRWKFTGTQSLSCRAEYFHDPQQAIIPITGPAGGFQAGSAGLCWNIKLAANTLFRLEGRQFFSTKNLFGTGNSATWLLTGFSAGF